MLSHVRVNIFHLVCCQQAGMVGQTRPLLPLKTAERSLDHDNLQTQELLHSIYSGCS